MFKRSSQGARGLGTYHHVPLKRSEVPATQTLSLFMM